MQMLATLCVFALLLATPALAADPVPRKTTVDIHPSTDTFLINNQPTLKGKTFEGHSLEGLLPNARVVQAIFDDENPESRGRWKYPDGKAFDAERNTREFVAAMPAWRAHGLLAITVNLQGGSPQGYSKEQPWINSAFTAEGALKPAYMARLEKVLDKADELGMVVILGYFYFGQEPKMKDEAAIIAATKNATEWLVAKGYTHVVVEVANECDIHYKQAILKPGRMPELFGVVREVSKGKAKNAAGRLLVSASLSGGKLPAEEFVKAADFVLLHGNGVKEPAKIADMVEKVRALPIYRSQPVLFNEDDHFNFDKPKNNFLAATSKHASWGYFDFRMKDENFEDGFQSMPADWGIRSGRKKAFFGLLKKMSE